MRGGHLISIKRIKMAVVEKVKVKAVIDTGATMPVLPQDVVNDLIPNPRSPDIPMPMKLMGV